MRDKSPFDWAAAARRGRAKKAKAARGKAQAALAKYRTVKARRARIAAALRTKAAAAQARSRAAKKGWATRRRNAQREEGGEEWEILVTIDYEG